VQGKPVTSLPGHKTKLVCTIGPASSSAETIAQMVRAGMSVARLNCAHGDPASHARIVRRVRRAADRTGRHVAIMADLPGPKMRIGSLDPDPVFLEAGHRIVLTSDRIEGTPARVAITMPRLPGAVSPGDRLYLNDGFIRLRVERVRGNDIHCTVVTGGLLRARKGLNIPGIDLGESAFTPGDRQWLAFAREHELDAVSLSFVARKEDVAALREAASEMGYHPFVIAKIERAGALDRLDEILAAADGIMVARGDLGVEIPIEDIAVAQKRIIRRANRIGKPVITATQMLESMTASRRPTRAEATDVANAILDGSDAVMLSEESAAGAHPDEAVRMLARIGAVTEPHQEKSPHSGYGDDDAVVQGQVDLVALAVGRILSSADQVAAILAPTSSGHTARALARRRGPVWILAVSESRRTCRALQFTRGVWPVHEATRPPDWTSYARRIAQRFRLSGRCLLRTEGPSPSHPMANHRLEIVTLDPETGPAAGGGGP